MTYRIMTNGKYHIIEKLVGSEWVAEECSGIDRFGFHYSAVGRFKTQRQADHYARKKWGTDATRKREWRIV